MPRHSPMSLTPPHFYQSHVIFLLLLIYIWVQIVLTMYSWLWAIHCGMSNLLAVISPKWRDSLSFSINQLPIASLLNVEPWETCSHGCWNFDKVQPVQVTQLLWFGCNSHAIFISWHFPAHLPIFPFLFLSSQFSSVFPEPGVRGGYNRWLIHSWPPTVTYSQHFDEL